MLFRQILDEDLGCASYFLAAGGGAIVIDPAWRIEPYLELAARHRVRITHVLDTHVHADHVSGRERLAEAARATSFVPLPGRRLPVRLLVRGLRIDVIDTAGHRPEHVSFLVTDLALSNEPCLLLAGDSLLVGDVARPDLATNDAAETRTAARQLLGSITRLAALPDHVEVWPGHIAGSLCGAQRVVDRVSSTIGFERLTNPGFALPGEDSPVEHSFVEQLVERLPVRPPTVEAVVGMNSRLEARPQGRPPLLAPAQVEHLLDAGAVVFDGRRASEFDEASIPGSLSTPLELPGVGTRAAWSADPASPVVAAGDDELQALEVAARLEAVGFREVRGILAGGLDAWIADGRAVRRTPVLSVKRVAELVRAGAVTLIDLRDEDEVEEAGVPGCLHVPWRDLRERADEVFAPGTPVVVACATGRRTALAASLLAREGGETVSRIAEGGIPELAALIDLEAVVR